jgi:enoyl-CoA hydratase/carnithine racemase
MTEHILISVADKVLHIRLNRPEKKNAITFAMYDAMADALEQADGDDAIRVITIFGSGDAFTSGNDLADFLQPRRLDSENPASRFLATISRAGKPLIACVNGLAVGVGVTMLLHCDLIYAADTATFQMPFVNLGLVPEAASSFLLPRMIGHQRAAHLFLSGERFDAQAALGLGLVNAVYPAASLEAETRNIATALAMKPPAAIRATKALLKADTSAAVAARLAKERAVFEERLKSPEAREAMEAFLQRRAPDFSRFG